MIGARLVLEDRDRETYRDRVHAMARALASRSQVINVAQIVRQAREVVQAVDEDLAEYPPK